MKAENLAPNTPTFARTVFASRRMSLLKWLGKAPKAAEDAPTPAQGSAEDDDPTYGEEKNSSNSSSGRKKAVSAVKRKKDPVTGQMSITSAFFGGTSAAAGAKQGSSASLPSPSSLLEAFAHKSRAATAAAAVPETPPQTKSRCDLVVEPVDLEPVPSSTDDGASKSASRKKGAASSGAPSSVPQKARTQKPKKMSTVDAEALADEQLPSKKRAKAAPRDESPTALHRTEDPQEEDQDTSSQQRQHVVRDLGLDLAPIHVDEEPCAHAEAVERADNKAKMEAAGAMPRHKQNTEKMDAQASVASAEREEAERSGAERSNGRD